MEVKNLFDPAVKQETIERINKLTPQSQRQWGKMDVAQMLAHLQLPIQVAYGTHTVQANWLMKLILPLFKKTMYNEKPWKKGLPTDKSYIMTGKARDFEIEKKQLIDLINQFDENKIVNERHPVFGKFTKEQCSMSNWKHLDHHLRQFGV